MDDLLTVNKMARKYFENMPYGKDALSSEIHGKENQRVINEVVSKLSKDYDEAMANGDKELSKKCSSVIRQISYDLDQLKQLKEEFAMNFGGGVGGKNLFSNYTNLKQFDIPFWLEKGRINFDENYKPVLSVQDSSDPTGKNKIFKRIQDVTEQWVIKGTEENDYMKMQQDAVKQRNNVNQPLDFDVDWQMDNLLTNNDAWKVFVSDKIGGRYFLQDYVMKNKDKIQSGEIPDEMLHPNSFNPANDTRLHEYYSDRIKKSFDPNYLSREEVLEARRLQMRVNDNKA